MAVTPWQSSAKGALTCGAVRIAYVPRFKGMGPELCSEDGGFVGLGDPLGLRKGRQLTDSGVEEQGKNSWWVP